LSEHSVDTDERISVAVAIDKTKADVRAGAKKAKAEMEKP
jgi:hypothetical protein